MSIVPPNKDETPFIACCEEGAAIEACLIGTYHKNQKVKTSDVVLQLIPFMMRDWDWRCPIPAEVSAPNVTHHCEIIASNRGSLTGVFLPCVFELFTRIKERGENSSR